MTEPTVSTAVDFSRVKPQFSYAGGKRRMLAHITANAPERFGSYFEPFLGAGAVAIEMMKQHPSSAFHLSDLNSEIILTWQAIRDEPQQVLSEITEHYDRHNREYFLAVRDWDRSDLINHKAAYERAGRFIYLANSCFGGGYKLQYDKEVKREVCANSYADKRLFAPDNLLLLSALLNERDVHFYARDFIEVAPEMRAGDFVYLDPPYATDHKDAAVHARDDYAKSMPTSELTKVARALMEEADRTGAYCLLSNASTKTTNDLFNNFASVEHQVVWSGGAGRRANTEKLWANDPLRRVTGQTTPLDIHSLVDADDIPAEVLQERANNAVDKARVWEKLIAKISDEEIKQTLEEGHKGSTRDPR